MRLGAPDFKPSSGCPVGWRGDGNGRYPAADPPLTWGRNSTSVMGLSSQTKKPKEGEPGKPTADGVIRRWLTVGPVVIPEGKAAKADFFDEPKLIPDEGDRLGGLAWKAVNIDTPWIHFQAMHGKIADLEKVVAYATPGCIRRRARPSTSTPWSATRASFGSMAGRLASSTGPASTSSCRFGKGGTRSWCRHGSRPRCQLEPRGRPVAPERRAVRHGERRVQEPQHTLDAIDAR